MRCCVQHQVPGWPAWAQHALVSVPLWGMAAAPALLALALQGRPSSQLALAFAGVCLGYHLIYRALSYRAARQTATAADA
jgi:hypothetical protein